MSEIFKSGCGGGFGNIGSDTTLLFFFLLLALIFCNCGAFKESGDSLLFFFLLLVVLFGGNKFFWN